MRFLCLSMPGKSDALWLLFNLPYVVAPNWPVTLLKLAMFGFQSVDENHLGLIALSVLGLVRRDSGYLKSEAARTVPKCSQLQAGWSTPVAQRANSQWTAAGFEPRTFSTCVPQPGTLTNCAY